MRVTSGVRFSWSWLVFVVFLLPAVPASAQATRTWVSGVGDDANPCSRTAPCKTFAGAISKTATAGEINVLDAGAFGAVTITKSITISAEDVQAGVLATLGSNGIVVNAPSTSVVVLRGLDIEGAGSGGNGIRFLAGAALHVENCTINNFSGKGIDFQPNGAAELFVRDTVIRNNVVSTTNSGGILVKPTSTGAARVSLVDVQLDNNQFGLRVEANSEVAVVRGSANGNVTNGYMAVGTAGPAVINLDAAVASNNDIGVRAIDAGAVVRISQMLITGNATRGMSVLSGGTVISFGNNSVNGNGLDGTPTATVSPI